MRLRNLFSDILNRLRGVFSKVLPVTSIQQAEGVESPLSVEMTNALNSWYRLYRDEAPWIDKKKVFSYNLPKSLVSEMARGICIESKWDITGEAGDNGDPVDSELAVYLKEEFSKLMDGLRLAIEPGLAAGGLIIKPYYNPGDQHFYFDCVPDWGFFPLAFDDDGNLTDVVIPDIFQEGLTTYTRLERQRKDGDDVVITHKAFKSSMPDSLGTAVDLSEVDRWSALKPEIRLRGVGGQLFGWFKVATANQVDPESPMGGSLYGAAVDLIRQVDYQYSRILWEFEATEAAIHVSPQALRMRKDGGGWENAKLNERLYRKIEIHQDGGGDFMDAFLPDIRVTPLREGLNTLLMRVEDICGLSRGSVSDANTEAKTATELKIIRQRTYAAVNDNQKALERCLRDVVRVMDYYCRYYGTGGTGGYEVSFTWDDSIVVDSESQTQERLTLYNAGMMSKSEFRQWYFGETKAQADAAIQALLDEQAAAQAAQMAAMSALGGAIQPGDEGPQV